MTANQDQTISDLRALAVDLAQVDAALADLRATDKMLTEAQRRLKDLRPTVKDYQTELQNVSALINALSVSLAGCKDDVNKAVEDAKTAAIRQASALEGVQARLMNLDARIVRLLDEVFGAVCERHASTLAAADMFGPIAGWRRERGEDVIAPNYLHLPGGHGLTNTAAEAFKFYLDRFQAMRPGGVPAPGGEVEWFNRRRW